MTSLGLRSTSLLFGIFVIGFAVACGDSGETSGYSGPTAGAGGEPSGGSNGSAGSSAGGGSDARGGTAGTTGAAGSNATGGASSGSGGSASSADLLDQIEANCERDCEAQFALECAPLNSNVLTCESQCVAATVQLGDFCLAEYSAYVGCRADGGYECVQDVPYPRATCASQQQLYSECVRDIGCKRYCARSIEEGCTSTPLDSCIEACVAERDALPSYCGTYLSSVTYCQATQQTAVCAGEGLSTPEACSVMVMYVAECLYDENDDMCEAWCWGADRLGCGGTDCAAECAQKLADPSCGTAFTDMLDCALFFGDAACSGEVFLANGICDTEAEAYSSCVGG